MKKIIILCLLILTGCAQKKLDAVTGGDSDTTNTNDTDDGNNTDSDTFKECATVSQVADNTFQPVDVVFFIDNSTSMREEVGFIQTYMNDFSKQIIDSGLDVHIVLIACLPDDCDNDSFHGICIEPPLGAGTCPLDETNLPVYLHVNQKIPSVRGLEMVIEVYDQWVGMMRYGSAKHFVAISDDTEEWSAVQFNDKLMELDSALFEGYQFNAIYSYMSKTAAKEISEDEPCAEFSASWGNAPDSTWEIYSDLIKMTDGVSGDLCLQDFEPVLNEIATSVIANAELSCEWEIPPPPGDEIFNRDKVNVKFTEGDGDTFFIGYIDSKDKCGQVEHAWYYDDLSNPSRIYVCPDTCTWIKGDDKARIDILFGCETENAPLE